MFKPAPDYESFISAVAVEKKVWKINIMEVVFYSNLVTFKMKKSGVTKLFFRGVISSLLLFSM